MARWAATLPRCEKMNSNLGRSKAVLMGLMLAGSLLVVFSPTAAARCHPITHDCFERRRLL